MRVIVSTLCSLLPFTLIACDRTGPVAPPETTMASSSDAQTSGYGSAADGGSASPSAQPEVVDSTVASFLGLEAPKPAAWRLDPPRNQMIATNFTVPGVGDSSDVHLNVYAGIGGSIHDNVQRWKDQFRAPDGGEVELIVDEFEVDSMPVTFVELGGEWMQMGAVSHTADQLFLAAIVDAPVGRLFIRFAGNAETVEANREAFMEMVRGMRRADNE